MFVWQSPRQMYRHYYFNMNIHTNPFEISVKKIPISFLFLLYHAALCIILSFKQIKYSDIKAPLFRGYLNMTE